MNQVYFLHNLCTKICAYSYANKTFEIGSFLVPTSTLSYIDQLCMSKF